MTLVTKPRWDKYDPYVGNFRAPLGADINLSTQVNKVLAVGINSSGAVVVGAGQTGVVGLMIVPVGIDIHGNVLSGGINCYAGDVQDVGRHGEITNFSGVAGTKYYAHADGSVDSTATSGTYVGHTVEATRLIVDVS